MVRIPAQPGEHSVVWTCLKIEGKRGLMCNSAGEHLPSMHETEVQFPVCDNEDSFSRKNIPALTIFIFTASFCFAGPEKFKSHPDDIYCD